MHSFFVSFSVQAALELVEQHRVIGCRTYSDRCATMDHATMFKTRVVRRDAGTMQIEDEDEVWPREVVLKLSPAKLLRCFMLLLCVILLGATDLGSLDLSASFRCCRSTLESERVGRVATWNLPVTSY